MDNGVKWLFPAYPIMHIGLGKNYIEYPLSKVLGSWGITIRDIWFSGDGRAEILCYGGKDREITYHDHFQVMPLSTLGNNLPLQPHCMDLILRYGKDKNRGLFTPKWTKAIWMNFGGCIVLDAVGQKSHAIRFIEDEAPDSIHSD